MNYMLAFYLLVVLSMIPTAIAFYLGSRARWQIAALNITPWVGMALAIEGIAAFCTPAQIEAAVEPTALSVMLTLLVTSGSSFAWAVGGSKLPSSHSRLSAPAFSRFGQESAFATRGSIES